jgi:hypothetical protein
MTIKSVKTVFREYDGVKIKLPLGLGFETHGDFRRWAHAHFSMPGNSVDYVSHIPATSEVVHRKFPVEFVYRVNNSEFLSPASVFLSNGENTYVYRLEYYDYTVTAQKKKSRCFNCVIC